jgi:hypothetical protein
MIGGPCVERIEAQAEAGRHTRVRGFAEGQGRRHGRQGVHVRQVGGGVQDAARERLVHVQDGGQGAGIVRLHQRPAQTRSSGGVGRGVEARKAERQPQPFGPRLRQPFGPVDQGLLIHAHADDALRRAQRRVGIRHRRRQQFVRPVHAAEQGHDLRQGDVTPLHHVGQFVERARGGGHAHHGGVQPRPQVGVGPLGRRPRAVHRAVGLGLGEEVEREARGGDQGPGQQGPDARHTHHLVPGFQRDRPDVVARSQIQVADRKSPLEPARLLHARVVGHTQRPHVGRRYEPLRKPGSTPFTHS